MSTAASHDPAALLAKWWATYTAVDEDDDVLSADRRLAVTAPFEQSWPGRVSSREAVMSADQLAAEYAEVFPCDHPQSRLGLVSAVSGAEALTTAGWSGPANYDNDTVKFAAIAGDWENRLGARVVAVGFSTLHLSVAAPPTTQEDAPPGRCRALRLLPDNIWQGRRPYTPAAYAEQLIGVHNWGFWWD